ncbi:hypothetical protein ACQP2F_13955 [Actinoplanes sp. CA-030573]|uniref:hypothetical protein n=1 Tax=Actinoplanes sp. CA-030573 TaxID=3239898 RepID=UPI003D912AF1
MLHPRAGRWLLAATAVLQACAPPVIGFDSDAADPPIVPPGTVLRRLGRRGVGCLIVAAWGLPAQRATVAPYRDIQVPLALVQVGFVLWLLAAGSPARWLTVPIFAGMLTGLGVCLRQVVTAIDAEATDRITGRLLGIVLGVDAGWSTAAVWINTATLLPSGTFTGTPGLVVQCGFVVAASGTAAVGAHLLRGQASYALTAGWALIGVAVSAVMAGLEALAAIAGLVLVGAIVLVRRRSGPAHRPV